jgi:hypothetical protein
MSRIHCSHCGQAGHTRNNYYCLVNTHQRTTNSPFVVKWVFKRSTSRMTPENRQRFNQCRTYLSDAIDELTVMARRISTYQPTTAPPNSYFMMDVIRQIHRFVPKINQALEYDSVTRPLISAAPIFTYLMAQITRFNELMMTITTVVASLENHRFSWRLLEIEEPPVGQQIPVVQRPIVKRTSAYFKEISLARDLTIEKDAPECDCPLCFDSVHANDVLVTNCNHSFCVICVKRFATVNKDKTKKPDCPMCRTDITEFKVGNQQVYNDIQEHILNL